MKLIAHRGNINGPSSDENNPKLIEQVLALGYDVEIDVWLVNAEFFLGHDEPTYHVSHEWINTHGYYLWCHAKNFEALVELKRLKLAHYFSHDQDDRVLTSCGYFWTFPGKELSRYSIAVMPEVVQDITTLPKHIYGVCSDHVSLLK